MEATFTAVYQKEGKWWLAYVEEIPGANTQGKSLEEARANLKEAVALVLEANRDIARCESAQADVIREELTVALP